MSRHSIIRIGALTFTLASCAVGLALGEPAAPAAWGDLEPGPYAVGFRAVEKYDYSRSFEAKKDYFGTPLPGERGRPVQVCMWYPATAADDDPRMVYGEYAFVYPGDSRFYAFLSSLQDREVNVLHYVFSNDQGAVIDLQSESMAAVRDAPAAPGRFPLILYAPYVNGSITENVILCEYLASHGFVVASTHAYGRSALRSHEDAASLDIVVTDLGFVLATMHAFEFVDHDRLGVAGGSAGALAALLFQMENLYVDAVAGLSAAFLRPEARETAEGMPGFDARRASAPMIQIYGGAEEGLDPSLLDSLEYSERYVLAFTEMAALSFTSYRACLATVFAPDEAERKAYEAACIYVRSFFDAHLKGDENSMAFLKASPERNGLAVGPVEFSHLPGREVPPTQEQFIEVLRERGVDAAVGIFEKFRREDPDLVLFEEYVCNYAGYGYLQRGQPEAAVAVFRMNAETYPGSANTWDSLAEAYLAAGDEEHAAECYRRVLEVLPDDPRANEELRAILRSNAEQFLNRPEE